MSKYGLTMLISTDERVKTYLCNVLEQMTIWLRRRSLRRVVVVFASVATKKVLERWSFDVKLVEDCGDDSVQGKGNKAAQEKAEREIVSEIQAVVRQITASVTFLPLLDEACSFDMLIYTDQNTETPAKWEESDARIILDKENVQLRSFSTNVHNVDASVSYARDNSYDG